MDRTQEYIVQSLEQHLFFARIMKEHAFFLKVGFLPPCREMAEEAEGHIRKFEALLSRAIGLSDCIVRRRVLCSGELVTEFTDCAERQTQRLTGTALDCELTARVLRLKGREGKEDFPATRALVGQVRQLNREGLQLVNCLIGFKERLLCGVGNCAVFTVNYPMLIEHILREARLYRENLLRLEGNRGSQDLRDSEPFWNRIMMEHALFIRGLLDPGEEALVRTANEFAGDYRRLLETAGAANEKTMGSEKACALTRKFRDFKQAGTQGIEACQIRSILLPLLADHVLREANHYLRILED